jgi:hypothetical protein
MRTDADDPARVRDPAIELLLSHTATLTAEWCNRGRARRQLGFAHRRDPTSGEVVPSDRMVNGWGLRTQPVHLVLRIERANRRVDGSVLVGQAYRPPDRSIWLTRRGRREPNLQVLDAAHQRDAHRVERHREPISVMPQPSGPRRRQVRRWVHQRRGGALGRDPVRCLQPVGQRFPRRSAEASGSRAIVVGSCLRPRRYWGNDSDDDHRGNQRRSTPFTTRAQFHLRPRAPPRGARSPS